MTTLIYDGTFNGWLTAVFEIYEYKYKDVFFAKEHTAIASLFAPPHYVTTNEEKAQRVLNGLQQRLSAEGMKRVKKTFYSEVDKYEEIMWRFVQHVFASDKNVEEDFANTAVWELKVAARKVKVENHRMKAFIRFKLTKDQLYYAIIEPDCNVLPFIADHFKTRYADQRWLIYDARRKYGIYYDLDNVSTVELSFNQGPASSNTIAEISDEREIFFQDLWRKYFSSVNIEARKNLKLHVQHMPKRYWKHLTEKMPKL